MCGLLGEYKFESSSLTSAQEFKDLLALSKNRGPDSEGIQSTNFYQLGFNRLAVLDLSPAGDQPVQSPSGKYHLVFNGEIYNFQDLIGEFQFDHLRSSSDTEVILHLLDVLGINGTVTRLNGMFSIGIIDVNEQTLTLVRDFAGIKPLFYGINKSGCVFASQFDQIFKHPWFSIELSLRPEIMKEYFGFGYMQAPNTVFKNIFQVLPGEIVEVNLKGEISSREFYKLPKDPVSTNEEDQNAVSDFQQIFKEVINRQLFSDVPLGTFLSGGIDSPLVAATAKAHRKNIEAYTIKIKDHELDESDIAEKYAKHLHINQTNVEVDVNELLMTVEEHFHSFPEPFGDYSSIPTYIVTKRAKEKYTVMLSGDGGDELFWGYPRMLDVMQKRNWFKIPFLLRKPLNRITNKLNLSNTHAPFHFRTLDDFILNKQLKIGIDRLDEIFPDTGFSRELDALYSGFSKGNRSQLLQDLRINEFYAHMQRVLIKVDRTSMRHSLEVRVPFLDKEVIEMSLTLKPGLGIKHSLSKKVLKDAMTEIFPKELISPKKRGFTVPIEDWLRGPLREDLIKTVIGKPLYGEENFEKESIKKYVQDFLDKKIISGWGVWHIYAWQKWALKNITNEDKFSVKV